MPLVLPKFPHHWSELSAQAKGLLTPNEDKKKKLQKPIQEDDSEAHQVFRAAHLHSSSIKRNVSKKKSSTKTSSSQQAEKKIQKGPSASSSSEKIIRSALTSPTPSEPDEDDMLPGISSPGSTGVIFVMDRAMANGFSYDDPTWANFGQGAPEVGDIPGASHKPAVIDVAAMGEDVHEYAPTTGVKALRAAVADLYNHTYRKGMDSQYTFESSECSGGSICRLPTT
ncbi:hypothetical protein PGT21_007519 [Puccinia graminis f. sp. tritici]|uniref:Uncharacterized protein n=1 Tax=Puccinia graminis f. sp. tritici TaxID=56615 RepID=A0A5B0LMU9_PUCGR|nr:hypothetical protein PGT21_007519 [Puccinia graminis f. sp. tritici]